MNGGKLHLWILRRGAKDPIPGFAGFNAAASKWVQKGNFRNQCMCIYIVVQAPNLCGCVWVGFTHKYAVLYAVRNSFLRQSLFDGKRVSVKKVFLLKISRIN